eukprot:jgi/Mesvir1/23605/Mv18288-RA.1
MCLSPHEDIAEHFQTFPGPRLPDGCIAWEHLRELLSYLRSRVAGHAAQLPGLTFSHEHHVNEMLHAVRRHLEGTLGGPTTATGTHAIPLGSLLSELQNKTGALWDAFVTHMASRPRYPTPCSAPPPALQAGPPLEQDLCADLPEHIQGRKGSCELKRLRHRLESRREVCALHDTGAWAQNFERALGMMWEIREAGLSPMHLVIPSKASSN